MPNITRYNQPFSDLIDELFERNLSKTFSWPNNWIGNKGGRLWVDIDIAESDNHYLVKADIPGMESKDIKVTVDQHNNLVIEGERESESKKEQKGGVYFERYKGSFYRKIALPGMVDTKNVKAKYQNGVLELTIPKSQENTAKQITVES